MTNRPTAVGSRFTTLRATHALSGTLLLAVLMLVSNRLHAQDPFEIQVYEYPTVPKGMWNLETHLNYAKEGWDFEPGARFAYALTPRFEPSLEYYGAIGPLGNILPTNEQVHQFFPGGDFQITENIVWNFGVGIGLTDAGNRLVYRTRIGILFGRKQN